MCCFKYIFFNLDFKQAYILFIFVLSSVWWIQIVVYSGFETNFNMRSDQIRPSAHKLILEI